MSAVAYTALQARYSDWSVDDIIDTMHVGTALIVIFKLGRPHSLGRQYQHRAAAFYGADNILLWDQPLSPTGDLHVHVNQQNPALQH
ncbi:hypothetical protein CPT_Seuss103 [Caulobacter phage Seuss]|uniref:Uncharacterized protein n=1 Tax=Caulobacter phage Seuss TaxID=1675601 RepID=A0A0K1LMD6_9CAUD|nr:hypothetical protein HOR08_gp103 [Caulobacter phage Seuss]AKU43629.1 hypothetical protein CPT_Seuss103 [Caulobacter phage Seuss]